MKYFDELYLASVIKDDTRLEQLYKKGCSNIDMELNKNRCNVEKRLRKRKLMSNIIDMSIHDILNNVSIKNKMILTYFKNKKPPCHCRDTGYGLCFHKHLNGLWVFPPNNTLAF